MQKNTKNLTSKQVKMIAMLLECPTKQAAAERVGIAQTTLCRWFADPVFVAAYQEAVKKFLDENICQLQTRTDKALETLVAVLDDDTAGVSARINAARAIYDYSFKARDLGITAKLDELERIVKSGGADVEVVQYDE